MRIRLFDTTLREGSQSPGTAFSLRDKLRLVALLDEIGVECIEAGNPYSNVKDRGLFRELLKEPPKRARLCAFGSTMRLGVAPEDDYNIGALIEAQTPVVCVFGKSSLRHVETVLRCTPEQNLELIKRTVSYLVKRGKEVVYDAEHFFDGCALNEEYAMQTVLAAKEAGASNITLCDTNGGAFVRDIQRFTGMAVRKLDMPVGIHCHDDSGLAAANTIEAVLSGASLVQTTLCGWGERCGNADFFEVIPSLQLKLGCECVEERVMRNLRHYFNCANEIANAIQRENTPYVGKFAFAHKAGMHIDAVNKDPCTFEHIDPALVGGDRAQLLSEFSGRSAVLQKVRSVVPEMTRDSPFVTDVLNTLKRMEMEGYQFEGAEASFELLVRRMLKLYMPFFNVAEYKVVAIRPSELNHTATAMIRVNVGEKEEITAADGDGPVNALDIAMRKALERFYPALREMKLNDYKVRVLDSRNTTASRVRVMIESRDEDETWTTVGVHEDVLQASFIALTDSLEYKLLRS